MPNAPKTPTRTIRVSHDLWTAAQAQAAEQGITVTSVLIEALEKFATKKDKTTKKNLSIPNLTTRENSLNVCIAKS